MTTVEASSLLGVFARLKLRLLRNGLKSDRRTKIATVAMFLASVIAGITTAYSFVKDANEGPAAWSRSLVPGFTMIFLAWVFGPLLLGGVDDALDPRRLTLLPLRTNEMIRGIAVGAMLSFLPIGTVIALGGVVVAHAKTPVAAMLIVVACASHLVLVFSCGRLLSAVLAWTSRTRRGRDIGVFLAAVAAAVLWLGAQSLNALEDNQVDTVNRVLQWSPAGALGRAVIDARTGNTVAAVLRIAVVLATAFVAIRVWSRLLQGLLVTTVSVRDGYRVQRQSSVERVLTSWVARFGGSIAGIVFTKELRYLRRSPGRRAALAISMVMGVPFVMLQVMRSGGFQPGVVYYAPISLMFGLGAVNNLVGMDGPALWLEVTSGAKLREILIGRGAAAMPFLVVPSTLTAVLLVLLSKSSQGALDVLVFVWFGWGIQVGLGSYLSVVAPFSQTDDNNPFSNSRAATGSSVLVMIVAMVGIGITAVIALPLIWGFSVTQSLGAARFLVMIPACALYSLLCWHIGVRAASRRIERRGIDLLGLLTPRSSYQ